MSEKLKPCPFCGGEAEMRPWKYNGHDRYDFFCGHCGCSFIAGTCETKEEAIAKWNTRTERTCHHAVTERGEACCSACGQPDEWWLFDDLNYCPNCGARVLSEEEQGQIRRLENIVADATRRLEKAVER